MLLKVIGLSKIASCECPSCVDLVTFDCPCPSTDDDLNYTTVARARRVY